MTKKNRASAYLAAGILSSLIIGIALALLRTTQWDINLCSILLLSPAIAALSAIFPERIGLGRATIPMVLIGCLVGIAYTTTKDLSSVLASGSATQYALLFINISLVTPYFEELVVRRLMYLGLASFSGSFVSAVVVSALFSLAHRQIYIFAGLFSLVMCYLTSRGITTFNRAALHGAYNLTASLVVMLNVTDIF